MSFSIDQVDEVLAKVRPWLQQDGGDIEFVRYNEETGVVFVRFLGNCRNCPMSIMTLRAGVERFILHYIPGTTRVEMVQ